MIPVNKITKWHNCYDDSWQGIIVPEAFSHPGKMSYGLLSRILSHAQEQRWINGVILDPFGGIGSTGILGAYEGYQVVCVELEQKFVDLAEQNFEIHKDAWVEFGNPFPVMIQGDSRRLCALITEKGPSRPVSGRSPEKGVKLQADCIVSSPPYSTGKVNDKKWVDDGYKGTHSQNEEENYGQTPGQLGSMKPGNVDCILSSPPYAESLHLNESPEVDRKRREKKGIGDENWHPPQIGSNQGYGSSKGNLGNLKSGDVDCVISSPPYEGIRQDGGKIGKEGIGGFGAYTDEPPEYWHTQRDQNNLGNLKTGDTFWSAAKIIIEQCHQILKPGGHAIWVVKSFVRKGKRVDFPGDWQRLCESVGFKTVCVHQAMLIKKEVTRSLFGNILYDSKSKKSFFRRLIETKYSYNKYWLILTRKQKVDFLREGKKDCWDSYNSLSDEEKAEMQDGIPKHPKPNKKSILSNAKAIAFIASGENIRDWNEEIRIDYEVVLCMRKSGVTDDISVQDS